MSDGTTINSGDTLALELPGLILQYGIVFFVIALEIAIVVAIFRGKINLELLISEKNGAASLSRFQLLLFTFAIVGLYVTLGISGNGFPEFDDETLWLLGISGGTYGGSKFIQMSHGKTEDPEEPSGRFIR